jgi:uncharacterized membrane protein YhaH (DUF805 family)
LTFELASGTILEQVKAYLLGRAKRPEYWICVVCMTIVCMVANVILRNSTLVSGLSFIPWAIIASRRLRDFGRSPWWCVSTVVGGFILGFVSSVINAFAQAGGGNPPLTPPLMMIGYALVSWGIIIYIGCQKSASRNIDRRAVGAEAALLKTFD